MLCIRQSIHRSISGLIVKRFSINSHYEKSRNEKMRSMGILFILGTIVEEECFTDRALDVAYKK